jgi:hypothetical protein
MALLAAAEAAKPAPTYEEVFPSLGGACTKPVAAPASTKPSYASFAKRLAEVDDEQKREEERRAAEKAERERRDRLDRQIYVGMYRLRRNDILNDYDDVEIAEEAEASPPAAGDLDYDAYGRRRVDADYVPPAVSDSSTEDDDTASDESDS